jgi:hypothetical protein
MSLLTTYKFRVLRVFEIDIFCVTFSRSVEGEDYITPRTSTPFSFQNKLLLNNFSNHLLDLFLFVNMHFSKVVVALSFASTSLALPGPAQSAAVAKRTTQNNCETYFGGNLQCCSTSSQTQNNFWQTLTSTVSGLLSILPDANLPAIIPTLTADFTCMQLIRNS